MVFGHDELIITLRVFGAVLIGGAIGMERTFHGRPAGFRTHALSESGKQFEYRMVLRGRDPKSAERLSQHLRKLPQVLEFRISPTGD